ncbi:acetyltransferase (GNAT) family protein [Rathayibacter sp. PhB179]|nr:acetyltransferase (GNAT) family protein [Rathayibacter sp. PhB179]
MRESWKSDDSSPSTENRSSAGVRCRRSRPGPSTRGVVEHSVYIAAAARGRGVGSTLLAALIAAADDATLWMIQSSIFPENTASLALHDRAGFRRVGTRERIAQMTYGPEAGRWRDTILTERRRPRGRDSSRIRVYRDRHNGPVPGTLPA